MITSSAASPDQVELAWNVIYVSATFSVITIGWWFFANFKKKSSVALKPPLDPPKIRVTDKAKRTKIEKNKSSGGQFLEDSGEDTEVTDNEF